ncbi:MAG: dipeptide epimerase [Candidatus Omnitrophota bacterium]|jgi:L-alanine-DL-glutamate epimerase-like enolase superfamily enzyme
MKSTIIKKASVSPLNAGLIQPFRTALGQHDSLRNLLFRLRLADGTTGCGEAAIAGHITGETVEQTLDNLRLAAEELQGKDVCDYLALSSRLHEQFAHNKSAVAAIETAVLDALTRQLKIPLWKFFGNKTVELATDITIVIADLEETAESTRKFYSRGFRTFKVKIGRNRDLDLDLKRVLAVKKAAPGCEIYLDANQGYNAQDTLRFVKDLRRSGVTPALIEQPVPREDWEGLKKVTRLCGIPVCADESVRSVNDSLRAIREKATHAINIKIMKSGLIQSREIALLARSAGIKLMIGGMMESSLAMTASAHLAAGLGCFSYIDLDTPFFIRGGIAGNPCLNSRGIYDLTKIKTGIGIIPE